MDWLVNRPIAHRGFHHNCSIPENSLTAFEAAMAHNYPIELDVHLLADGNFAVFHDHSLKRMTGIDGEIAAENTLSIKKFRLLETDQQILLLEEVFELVNGKVPLLIEIKNQRARGQLEANLFKKLSGYSGEYALQSFNPITLGWFKENAPHIIRGQLSSSFQGINLHWSKKFILKNFLMNGISSPDFIAYDIRHLPYLPVTLTRKIFQVPLLAWTIKTESEKIKAFLHAENIIFENIQP